LLSFYFEKPNITDTMISEQFTDTNMITQLQNILQQECNTDNFEQFFNNIKQSAKKHNIGLKQIFSYLRFMLTGQTKGLGIHELEKCLGFEEIKQRICK
jgi:glutamyl/glutaminyl-tRNA synthetase